METIEIKTGAELNGDTFLWFHADDEIESELIDLGFDPEKMIAYRLKKQVFVLVSPKDDKNNVNN